MIELEKNQLAFRFPDVHRDAVLRIGFQRTLRIPDDDRRYPLPPGLGLFPLRHVDDFAANVPGQWIEHGGVMLPMYQSEALWLHFNGHYPFAVKVATGKIDAVTGKELRPGLARRPQNYLSIPEQPWLDGYCVEKGVIRQLVVHPMKAEAYERWQSRFAHLEGAVVSKSLLSRAGSATGMGLAPGGRMRQEIYDDPHTLTDWDQDHTGRCFVHLANSLVWRQITGEQPPTVPPTAREYAKAGLPWFEYYADGLSAVEGSGILEQLKSVMQFGKHKGDVPLPENEPVHATPIVELRRGLGKGQVREGRF
jgi:hypothetical protein